MSRSLESFNGRTRPRWYAGSTKRMTIRGLRRTTIDLLRRAAVDPVAATAISADEARSIGARLGSFVPAVSTKSVHLVDGSAVRRRWQLAPLFQARHAIVNASCCVRS